LNKITQVIFVERDVTELSVRLPPQEKFIVISNHGNRWIL
jgi:hypothetical protein